MHQGNDKLFCRVTTWAKMVASSDAPPRWRHLLYEFTQDTTLHGIRYVTRDTQYWIRRWVPLPFPPSQYSLSAVTYSIRLWVQPPTLYWIRGLHSHLLYTGSGGECSHLLYTGSGGCTATYSILVSAATGPGHIIYPPFKKILDKNIQQKSTKINQTILFFQLICVDFFLEIKVKRGVDLLIFVDFLINYFETRKRFRSFNLLLILLIFLM